MPIFINIFKTASGTMRLKTRKFNFQAQFGRESRKKQTQNMKNSLKHPHFRAERGGGR